MHFKKPLSIFLMMSFVFMACLSGCSSDQTVGQINEVREYVVNQRTGKIHIPTCSSVSRMSEKNKLFLSDTLLSLLQQRYVICRRCRAGIQKSQVDETFNHLFHRNLYVDEIEITASRNDYLRAIDEMGEWYVNHVPTYASKIQDEDFSNYTGNLVNYKEYRLKSGWKTSTQLALSLDPEAPSTASLHPNDQILRGTENAAVYYRDYFKQIDFDGKIAYYPCDFFSESSDYNQPGDDCVRYLFAIFNRMDSQFTSKYAQLTKKSYSKTDSSLIAKDYGDVAYGFVNLGFEIYDVKPDKISVDNDSVPEGFICGIGNDFRLQKGDILAKAGHVHIYLGDGVALEAPNFGWGRVYRSYPQYYQIQPETTDGANYIVITKKNGEKDKYRRVYRYIGVTGGAQ